MLSLPQNDPRPLARKRAADRGQHGRLAGDADAERAVAPQRGRGDEDRAGSDLQGRPGDLARRVARDDALLLWDAIEAWVATYLAIYSPSADDVQADTEPQAWMREINADRGGRFTSTGRNGGVPTLAYLTELATHIIFRSAVQHAAVNFPQASEMASAPTLPLAAYAPAPSSAAGVTEQDWILQSELSDIEAEVDRRNEVRADYVHLKPSLVPQSTNI